LAVEPGTNGDDRKRLSSYGITHLHPNQSQKGNHYVDFRIEIPKSVTGREREIYEELRIQESSTTSQCEDSNLSASIVTNQ
jgi:DnaJ-class molecular chaperone